jgi:diguanylate cyclase (GGDEF)-like protein
MKRLIPVIAVILGWASAAWAAQPAPLTTLHAVQAISNAQAAQGPPVAFYATVTYSQLGAGMSFVQEGSDSVQVWTNANLKLYAGDRVLIKGKAKPSFRPIVLADSITVTGHSPLPTPVPASFDQLNRSELDGMRVTIRAVVHNKDVKTYYDHAGTLLHMQMDGGTIDAWVDGDDPNPNQDMFDNEIEVTGVSSGKLDGKMHHIGAKLHVSSFADVKILKSSTSSPWTLPVTPIDKILDTSHVTDQTSRIRVRGTVTFYQPSSAMVIQNGDNSLWIMTNTEKPLRIGSQVDVTGFATLHDNYLALTSGEILQSSIYTPIAPKPMTWRELPNSKSIFDLVSVEGRVMMEVREPTQDEYFLVSNGQVFSAIYYHPYVRGSPTLPMKQIPLGSTVRVSGICFPLQKNISYDHDLPADILMRTPGDIAVIANPPWVNTRHLLLIVGLLLMVVAGVGIRAWALERKVRHQTSALAKIEQRRSRILEDINGSRPLAEIVEEITELASLKLLGALCWCQIADGARLGNCPPDTASLRIVHQKIPARSGPPLGAIFAAFNPSAKPLAIESEALSMAVGLISLAIETRRLYTDLLHRSEFDLLTDIHNRFSLEKRLDAQIEVARQNAGIFGLIYVDLDKFKQVNDIYGHRIGDLYLQEAARRMKMQLRSHDLLARLGGDEFAVLLPMVRNRAGVEEIAQRLEHSFDAPLVLEGNVLHGSASFGIALYPEDSATTDGILNAADAAMYTVKNSKRQVEVNLI